MADQTRPVDPSRVRVVYRLPEEEAVTVRRDVPYRTAGERSHLLDIYYPPDVAPGARTPAMIVVVGFPDAMLRAVIGATPKDTAYWRSWGTLIAASGMVAITYTSTAPAADAPALVEYVRNNAATLGVDENRLGLAAWSGHVPTALSLLTQQPNDHLKCAVLCYGFMLDLDGSTRVAECAQQYLFANPAAGRSMDDIPPGTALMITRAGRDRFEHLNEAIDRFVVHALRRNLPLSLLNLPEAPHSFDMTDDNATSRDAIARMLAFMQFHLLRGG